MQSSGLGNRQGRNAQILLEQAPKLPIPDAELECQCIHVFSVQISFGYQPQRACYRCSGSLPCRGSGRGFWPAPKTRSEPIFFGCCGTTIKSDVSFKGFSCRTNRSAIDAGGGYGCKKPSVESRVTTLQGRVAMTGVEFHSRHLSALPIKCWPISDIHLLNEKPG
jgi:hypothetical protein